MVSRSVMRRVYLISLGILAMLIPSVGEMVVARFAASNNDIVQSDLLCDISLIFKDGRAENYTTRCDLAPKMTKVLTTPSMQDTEVEPKTIVFFGMNLHQKAEPAGHLSAQPEQ